MISKKHVDKIRNKKCFYFLRTVYRNTLRPFFPTELMVHDKMFYKKNINRFERVYNNLSDDVSKQIYTTILKYRVYGTGNIKLKRIREPEHDQYFPLDLFDLANEHFCDCGAFDGDTLNSFFDHCEGNYGKYYGFEPGKKNFIELKKRAELILHKDSFELFNLCTWNKREIIHFCDNGPGGRMSAGGDEYEADSIDNLLLGKKVSFIKMDIEGSETKALEGARTVIYEQRPILAICIYHSMEDMVEIPLKMMEQLQNYSFYIRHYTSSVDETVLYCIPHERDKNHNKRKRLHSS